MANTLRFKRGLVSGIPTAALGEPLFTTDTFDLYIGNGTGNTRFQKYIASGTTSQLLRGDGSLLTMPIVLTSPSNGQVLKYNGTSWVNDSDAGITGSGASGQVAYFTGATTQSGSNNLFWDNANGILSVGSNVNLSTAFRSQFVTNGNSNFVTSAAFGNTATFRGAFYMLRGRGTQSSPSAILSGDELGQIQFAGYFGTLTDAYVTAASIRAIAASDFTTVTQIPTHLTFSTSQSGSSVAEKMRLTDTGRLLLGSTTDNGLRLQVTGDGFFSGSVGIGASTGLADINLRITKALAGSVFPASISIDGTIAQAATSAAVYVQTSVITEAAAFTLPNLYHFRSTQRTFGAGSTVVNQYGFFVDSSLVGATSNFGFYGNIASGTNRWNLYMNGTAANYLAGNLGLGTTTPSAPLMFGKSVYGNPDSENFYRIKFQDNGGIANDIGIGQTVAGGLAFNVGAASSTQFFEGTNGERMRLWGTTGNLAIGGSFTSDAGFRLDVNGTMRVSGDATINNILFSATAPFYTGANIYTTGSNLGIGSTGSRIIGFFTNNTERARIDASGNLGLGVTPSAWFTGSRVIQIGATAALWNNGTNNSAFSHNAIFGDASTTYIQTGLASYYRQLGGQHQWFTAPSGTAGNAITFTQAMTLDASGNLGLGVTPSAWGSGWSALQIKSGGLSLWTDGGIRSFISTNTFYNGTNRIYVANGTAAEYAQDNGTHLWRIASTGTAGGTISFTQAMTLQSTGNLVIGSTSDTGERLQVTGTMRVSGASTFGGLMTLTGAYISLNANGYIRTDNANFLTLQSGSSGFVVKNSGNANDNFVVNNSGAGTFLSSATATTFIAASSQPNTSDYNYLIFNNLAGGYGDWNIYKSGANNLSLGYGTDGGATYTNAVTFAYGGAATFSSSLTVDTDTFFVDATNNRVGVGTITPSYKAHIVNNASSPTYLALQNTTAGSASAAIMKVISDASSGSGEFLKKSSTGNTYKVMTSNDLVIYNDTAGDIDIFNDHANGKINLTSGGSSSTQLTLDTSGRLGFSNNSPTAYCDLAASTTAIASLRIRSGSAPTAPNDGDIWFDGIDLKMRIGGVTKTFTLV